MFRYIKKCIPEPWKAYIHAVLTYRPEMGKYYYPDSKKKHIFVFLAGFYQNLGDMAITYAQIKFLEHCHPDLDIIPVSSHETYAAVFSIQKFIQTGDMITIVGGGNMSDRYQSLENCRRFIIKHFPQNRIICLPQTVDFSSTKAGRKSQKKSDRVYGKHRDLTIFVREPFSLERIKKAFPNVKVGYCPDIVLSLDKTEPQRERFNVLCCMRSDKEQATSNIEKEKILSDLKEKYGHIIEKDTVDVLLDQCMPDTYEKTLEEFWELLKTCKVVVTDRLHCMIFCTITGTPCVAMDNSNHKISGVYEAWLKDVPYIKMIQDSSQMIHICNELIDVDGSENKLDFQAKFESLRSALKND